MTVKNVVQSLDSVLNLWGFRRRNKIWNRRVGVYIDAVELLRSKFYDRFTLELGVINSDIYKKILGKDVDGMMMPMHGIVRVNIGNLIDLRERWWNVDDDSSGSQAVSCMTTYGASFLNDYHSNESMKNFLIKNDIFKKNAHYLF